MKKVLLNIALAGALTVSVTSFADTNNVNNANMQQAAQAWQNMSDSQKEEARANLKAAWNNLSPQEQAQVRKKAQKKWNKLTPTQRQQLIDDYTASKAKSNN